MKYGIEVEGKYKGIKSVFLQLSELYNMDLMILPKGYNHLYITNDTELTEDLNDIINLLLVYYNITFETTVVPDKLSDEVHIMLDIKSDEIWKLKDTDSIKMYSDKNQVKSISIENMYNTNPEDFLNDKQL